MRVLLTGGDGFIDSHLCDAIIAQGDTPVILDNLSTGQLSNIAHLANKVEIHQIDNVISYSFTSGLLGSIAFILFMDCVFKLLSIFGILDNSLQASKEFGNSLTVFNPSS